MATILRAAESRIQPASGGVQFDDLAAQAAECLAQARAEAAEIVAQAEAQAADIRRQAAEAGCKAAMQEFERMVAAQVAPAMEALRQAAAELQHAKQAWISHWETGAVHLAAAIAARVIRREVRQQPEITLAPGARGVGTGRRQPQRAAAPQSRKITSRWASRCER